MKYKEKQQFYKDKFEKGIKPFYNSGKKFDKNGNVVIKGVPYVNLGVK